MDREAAGFFVNSKDGVDDLIITPMGQNLFDDASPGLNNFLSIGQYNRENQSFTIGNTVYSFTKWFHTHPGANREGFGYVDPSSGDKNASKYFCLDGLIFGGRGGIGAICSDGK
ncbi:MAG: hypothetical protein J0L66_18485 [Cytophagales bacterium]|nr:hypothetical protein [Cytophagales bacterium]